jgi:hypothetical protein
MPSYLHKDEGGRTKQGKTESKERSKARHGAGCSGQRWWWEGGGLRTGALLVDDAEGAGDGLAVREHRGGGIRGHAKQAVHGAGSVVRVRVAVNDANQRAGKAHGQLWDVGLGVFSVNETCK